MRARRLFCALGAAAVCSGSAHAGDDSFQTAVQPIFDANCVACHQTGAASQGLILESGSSYAAIVSHRSNEASLPLVAPNSPETSYLLLKLLGTHKSAGGQGERMPLGGALTADDIRTVRDWIAAGAKSD